MKKDRLREKLITATAELLKNEAAPETITSRQIAAAANMTPAMINYYFQSKDALIKAAVDRIIAEPAALLIKGNHEDEPPLTRLKRMLWEVIELTVKYRGIMAATLPFILLEGEITIPDYILPTLREQYGGSKTEKEIRTLAYQFISFMQLILYRQEAFYRYSGINLLADHERKEFFAQQFTLFFGEEKTTCK